MRNPDIKNKAMGMAFIGLTYLALVACGENPEIEKLRREDQFMREHYPLCVAKNPTAQLRRLLAGQDGYTPRHVRLDSETGTYFQEYHQGILGAVQTLAKDVERRNLPDRELADELGLIHTGVGLAVLETANSIPDSPLKTELFDLVGCHQTAAFSLITPYDIADLRSGQTPRARRTAI